MKKLLPALLLVCIVVASPSKAADAEEAQLIAVVQSDASAAKKEDACRRLKLIGTFKSAPALAALLADEHLYQAACDALETMPFAEAGQALQAALKICTGKSLAGVIHALGERRHLPAIPDLARFLKDSDPLIATAAARALGEIGGSEAIRALNTAMKTAAMHDAGADALLRCAVRLANEGDPAGAGKIFRELDSPQEKENIRAAAYAGLIRTAGDRALELVVSGINGSDPARQIVAVQLARQIRDPKATATFTNLLPKASPAVKLALIGLLQQRGDVAAAPPIFSLAQSEDAGVRVAAIMALGLLGDAKDVSLLAKAATSRNEAEQNVARQALLALRRGDVGQALLEQLAVATPAVQAELARALAGRAEKSAVQRLIELTRSDVEATRKAAFRALNQLADDSQFPQLVKLIAEAENDATRSAVRDVFESITQRSEAKTIFDVSPIVHGLENAKPETRIALLQVSALFTDEQLRSAFRAALKDPNVRIRSAAERVMCSSCDADLMPDLLELARNAADLSLRALALEGYVRLTMADRSDFPTQKRAALLKPAFDLAGRTEEKKAVLSALAGVPHPYALELVELANGEDVRGEAEIARLQIAKALLASAPIVAEKSLERLAANAQSGDVRTNAVTALQEFRKPQTKKK